MRLIGDRIDEVPVEVDGEEMSRVLGHLLINAIRRTPPDGTVAVAAHRSDGGVVRSVADGCGGIPEEDLPGSSTPAGAAATPAPRRPGRASGSPSCAASSRRTPGAPKCAT